MKVDLIPQGCRRHIRRSSLTPNLSQADSCIRSSTGTFTGSASRALVTAAAFLLSAALLLALPGCKSSENTEPASPASPTPGTSTSAPVPTSDTIPIGEFCSFTGDTATWGTAVDNGVKLAISHANAAGGVLGKKLDLISKDDASNQEQASTAVDALLGQNVVAVLGEVASTRSLRGAPLCQAKQIPMISPASTNPAVTKVGDYIFRVCFVDEFQGKMIAAIGKDILHAKTAAVIFDNSQDYSKGLKDFIESGFKAGGGSIVGERSYGSTDNDFKGQLTSIQGSNPDVIFVPGYYKQVAQIARQARELGINTPLVGGDGWDSPELTKIAGSALDNCYFTDHFAPTDPNPVVQGFVKDYKAAYGGMDPDAMAALGYDAAGVVVDAIKRAKSTDGPALRNAIAATKDYPGVTGSITIGPDRNAVKPIVIIKIVNGKFTFFKRFSTPS